MKALVKVAKLRASAVGGLAGAAVGALSGARKREGESERDRASRMLRRGMVGAGVGTGAGSVVDAGRLVKRLRDAGLKLRAKPNPAHLLAPSTGFVGDAAGAALGGAALGAGGGAAVQMIKGKKKGETDAEYRARVAKGALKGGAAGGALGAVTKGVHFSPLVHVDTEHPSYKVFLERNKL